MTSSEFKEKKETSSHELQPLYHRIPKELLSQPQIKVNKETAAWIAKGSHTHDLMATLHPELKSKHGQSYVTMFAVKNGEATLWGSPSGDLVFTPKEREDKEIIKLLESIQRDAAEHFEHGCKPEEIIFSDDQTWSGVVHRAHKNNVAKRAGIPYIGTSITVPCSLILNHGSYEWTNRAGENSEIFEPDPLAILFYMYEDYGLDPKFDFFYHLMRSSPRCIIEPYATEATRILCGDGSKVDFKRCYSFAKEDDWNEIRLNFKTDPEEVEAVIRKKVMRNLCIFLLDLGSKDYECRKRAPNVIIEGLKAARKHGILIDLKDIPDEFKNRKKEIESAMITNPQLSDFLHDYQKQNLDIKLANAIKQGDFASAKIIANEMREQKWSPPRSRYPVFEFISLANNVFSKEHPDLHQTDWRGKTLLDLLNTNSEISFKMRDALLFQLSKSAKSSSVIASPESPSSPKAAGIFGKHRESQQQTPTPEQPKVSASSITKLDKH